MKCLNKNCNVIYEALKKTLYNFFILMRKIDRPSRTSENYCMKFSILIFIKHVKFIFSVHKLIPCVLKNVFAMLYKICFTNEDKNNKNVTTMFP